MLRSGWGEGRRGERSGDALRNIHTPGGRARHKEAELANMGSSWMAGTEEDCPVLGNLKQRDRQQEHLELGLGYKLCLVVDPKLQGALENILNRIERVFFYLQFESAIRIYIP
jgi:hypothetical protein